MSDKFPGGFLTAGAPAGFSVAFDGASYLTVPSGAAVSGNSAFTVEFWVYMPSTNSGARIVSGAANQLTINMSSDGSMAYGKNGVVDVITVAAGTSLIGQWVHIAIGKSGANGTARIWRNGVSIGTATDSQTYTAGTVYIGSTSVPSLYLTGYISNLRITNTDVYGTSNTTINVPTQLFPITGTSLLTCQSPTLIDNSTNNYAITVAGTSKVSNFTPFAGYTGFNPALGAAAGGVWTLDEAAYYQNNRQWPIYDPYFKNTTLMLHGNGTNGAQNNTFLDSSTNNFTITRNGNTTQGTFTPFSQTGWSTYLYDGLIQASMGTNGQFGTGDFTVDIWVNPIAGSQTDSNVIWSFASFPNGIYLKYDNNGTCAVYYASGSNLSSSAGALTLNTWSHIAVCRSGTSLRLFINGVQIGSTVTDSTNYTQGFYGLGRPNDVASYYFRGYMSNFRVVKGMALYTANFTPSTSPLTAASGTQLLTFQSNRYVDNSPNNYAITVSGTYSVQAFSPFVPAYITPTTYSNWFNKSTGYLTVPSNAAFNFSTGDFTIECWVWFNQTADASGGGQCVVSGTSAGYPVLYISTNGGTTLSFAHSSSIVAGGTIQVRAWNHVAISRSGTSLRFFVNGILAQTATYSTAIDFGGVYIGAQSIGGVVGFIDGAISNLRMLKGTALYTANFTPPAEPLTNITNTSLLTCQSSTFIDNSTANSGSAFTVTAVGGVYPVTSPTPFPAKVDTTTLNSAYSTSLIGGSGYFDGTGDYLTVANNAAFAFGTGDFTVEFWYYPNNITLTNNPFVDTRNAGGNTAGFFVKVGDGGSGLPTTITATVGTTNITQSGLVGSAWNHVAITRASNICRVYVNGISGSTATISTNLTDNGLLISKFIDSNNAINGYLSSIRIVKGTAVYTGTTLTVPTAPLTAITNTSLLLSATNAGIFDNTAKNVLETVGNAQISTTQSKWGGSSIAFDGTTDWLQIPYSATGDLGGTTPFTIEFWVYMNSLAARGTVAARNNGSTAAGSQFDFNIETTGQVNVQFYSSSSSISTNSATGAITATSWIHVALTKDNSGNYKIYINGVQSGSTTTSTSSINSPTIPMTIGAQNTSGGVSLNGYIDDLRITKGVARYVANFTPPTSQLQDQ